MTLVMVRSAKAPSTDVTGLANGSPSYFAVTTVNVVDGENPAVQTVTATPNPVPGTFADLVITNVTAPASVYQGQTITVNWSVRNVGTGVTSSRNGSLVNAWTDRVMVAGASASRNSSRECMLEWKSPATSAQAVTTC